MVERWGNFYRAHPGKRLFPGRAGGLLAEIAAEIKILLRPT